MAQHDMNIANQGFPATRADLNNALQAIATNNSGTSEPSTTFANQWFYNTSTNKLFIRNEANSAFIEVATLDQTNNEWQITTGVIQAKDSDGLVFKTDDGTTRIAIADSDGDVAFDTDTLYVDAGNNRVAIGNTAPSRPLHITANPAMILLEDSDGSSNDKKAQIQVDSGVFEVNSRNDDDSSRTDNILCADLGTGNIGIGTNLPQRTLHVHDDSTYIQITNDTTGTTSSDGFRMGYFTGQTLFTMNQQENDGLVFSTNNTERMRINSSGNLLVGKDNDLIANAGIGIFGFGLIEVVRSGGKTMTLNRQNSDGEIINFRKDGSTVGSIGANGGYMYAGSGNVNLRYHNGADAILPATSGGASRDNVIDMGSSGARFDDIFATNTSINNSDENEKQNIASLTSAEISAATAISKLFKTYKWKDAVTKKGDAARVHTGHIAQQVQTAMSDAGLDASKYAFWCSDTWWEKDVEVAAVEADEEKGIEAQDAYTRTDQYYTKDEAPEGATERTRLGLRYPELLAFIGAATEQRLTSIEARLDALEG